MRERQEIQKVLPFQDVILMKFKDKSTFFGKGKERVRLRRLEGMEAALFLLPEHRKFKIKFPPCRHRWSKTVYQYRMGSISKALKESFQYDLGWETFNFCPDCGSRLLVDLPR